MKRGIHMKKCFFVTPIGDDNSDERRNSNDVLEFLLEPVCKDLGFQVTRVDQINDVDRITETIISELKNADLVIVDMTNHNPNVFYEFGFRHALNKPLIPIIKKDSSNIPFDVSTLRTITYSLDARPLSEAKQKLKDTINAFNFSEDTHSDKTPTSNIELSLLNIHDRLEEILIAINNRNIEDIDIISNQVAKFAKPAESIEVALMNKLFDNPKSIIELLKVADELPNS